MGVGNEGLIALRIFFNEQGGNDEGNCANYHENSGLPTVKNKCKGDCLSLGYGVQKEQTLWNKHMVRAGTAWQWNSHGDGADSEQAQHGVKAQNTGGWKCANDRIA